MNTIIIKIDPDEAANIQYLDAKQAATKNIISSFVTTNASDSNLLSTPAFEAYHKLYDERTIAFEEAKHELESKYISLELRAKIVKWNLDYIRSELIVIVNE